MNDELLPVGSIVKIKDGRKLMIIGFCPSNPVDINKYDYICCDSECGIIETKEKIELNRDYFFIKKKQIKNVLFIGFNDKKFDLFRLVIEKLNSKISESNNVDENNMRKIIDSSFEELKDEVVDKSEK